MLSFKKLIILPLFRKLNVVVQSVYSQDCDQEIIVLDRF